MQSKICRNFQSTIYIQGSASGDLTSCESCNTEYIFIEKKSKYKWTHTVQTCVVQGSTVCISVEIEPAENLSILLALRYSLTYEQLNHEGSSRRQTLSMAKELRTYSPPCNNAYFLLQEIIFCSLRNSSREFANQMLMLSARGPVELAFC